MSQMGRIETHPKSIRPRRTGGFASMTYSLSRAFIKSALGVIFAKKTSKTGNMMKIELDWCHLQADHLLENRTQVTSRPVGSCLFVTFCACTQCGWNSRNTLTQYHCARAMNSLWMHCAFAVSAQPAMQRLNAVRSTLDCRNRNC
jgi:hypothetical protein